MWSGIWSVGATRDSCWTWIWSTRDTPRTGAGNGWLISMLENLNFFCLTRLITLMLLMWKCIGQFLTKNHLLRCRGCLSLLNRIRALTLSLFLKLPARKLEPWFVLRSFFPLSLPCIYESTIQPCTFCCLEILEKLQKRICRIFGPELTFCLEPLADSRNVASVGFR